ncbi:MAG: SCO family protein [Rhodocyclales bacterium]|nr:SCO family protein [Rhodocyclales bacterium]
MTAFPHLGFWLLAAVITVLNIPLGGMRANAVRRSRRWFGLLAAPVFLLLFIGAPARAHHPGPQGNQWERLDADEPAPAFALTDQNGKRVALKDFRGTAIIVTFLFTHCTDVCPLLAQMLARVDQQLSEAERAKLRFVGISVDPRRDTPQQMKRFLQESRLSEARWTLLTGSVKELTRAARDYGVVVRPAPRGDLVHNTVFILIDAKGRERVEFHGLATPTNEIVKAVRAINADTKTKR